MANGTFPDQGRTNAINVIAGAGGANLRVRLYTNSPTIGAGSVLLDFAEATFAGYAPAGSGGWTAPAVATNDDVFIVSPTIIFNGPTSGTGQTITGYFVTIESGGSTLLWMAQAFPSPLPLALPADQIPLQVRIAHRALAA